MIEGINSNIQLIGDRIYKSIYCVDISGRPVGPYEEYKILNYVQNLGKQFPQNVKCEGQYQLSYSYVPGFTLGEYFDNDVDDELSLNEKIKIICQIIQAYKLLFGHGIIHSDYHKYNFIIDHMGIVHIIDFGSTIIMGRDRIGCYIEPDWSEELDEYISNHQPEPEEEYVDIKYSDERAFGDIIFKFIEHLVDEGYIAKKYQSMLCNCHDYDVLITLLENCV